MNLGQRLFSLMLALGVLWTSSVSFAQSSASCRSIFSTTSETDLKSDLATILNLKNLESRRDRKAYKILDKKNFERPLSEADVRLWVKSLFKVKHGDPNKFANLVGNREAVLDARLLRILQEEAASQGVIHFLNSGGLLKDRDHAWTVIKNTYHSNTLQSILSMTSLLSLKNSIPLVMLPQLKLFSLTETQMRTLLVKGKDSPEGQQVLKEILPKINYDRHYALFSRAFNRTSFLFSIVMAVWISNKEFDQEAEHNGEIFVTSLLEQMAKIASVADEPANTPDDFLFDIVAKKIEESSGRPLTLEERHMVCIEIPAPNRCK